jgi:hypothetical protein
MSENGNSDGRRSADQRWRESPPHGFGNAFSSVPLHFASVQKSCQPLQGARPRIPGGDRCARVVLPRRRRCQNFRPHDAPKNQSDLCRSGQADGLTPARHPPDDGSRLTRPARSRNIAAPHPNQDQQPLRSTVSNRRRQDAPAP